MAVAAAAAALRPRRQRAEARPRPSFPARRTLAHRAVTPAPAGGRIGGPPSFGSFPIGYKIQLSMDGKSWGAPVAQGQGSVNTTVATFKPTQAKFVRVTQTGSAPDAPAWSVLNFRIYAAGGAAK